MRKRFVQLLLLTLFVTLIGSTADAQNSATVLVLVHANLIDGVSPDVLHDATVVVRDGRIESVGGNVSAPTGAQVVDIKGRWLLPGFVDAHVHLRDLAAARHAVQSGATTVRALGSSYFADVGIRELHRAGLTDIPEVVAAGYQIRPDLSQGNGRDESGTRQRQPREYRLNRRDAIPVCQHQRSSYFLMRVRSSLRIARHVERRQDPEGGHGRLQIQVGAIVL